jgi:hypothetical protein
MSEVYLQVIHKNIMKMTNRWTLMKLENQIEEYINQNEQILFQNGTIEDVLDIRDAIITRISQLRREELLKSYTEEREKREEGKSEESTSKKSKTYQIQQYYCLIEKKIQLERELHAINNELLVLAK